MVNYFSTAPIRLDEDQVGVLRVRYDAHGNRRYKKVKRDIHRDLCVELPKAHSECCRGSRGDAWQIPMRTRRVADNLIEVELWDCCAGTGSHTHTCFVVEEKQRYSPGPPDIFLRAIPKSTTRMYPDLRANP